MSSEPPTKKIKIKVEKGEEPIAPLVTPKATNKRYPVQLIRGAVIEIGRKVGFLMMCVPKCLRDDKIVNLEDKANGEGMKVISGLKQVFSLLDSLASVLGTTLQSLVLQKMDVNAYKYEVSQARVCLSFFCFLLG